MATCTVMEEDSPGPQSPAPWSPATVITVGEGDKLASGSGSFGELTGVLWAHRQYQSPWSQAQGRDSL